MGTYNSFWGEFRLLGVKYGLTEDKQQVTEASETMGIGIKKRGKGIKEGDKKQRGGI